MRNIIAVCIAILAPLLVCIVILVSPPHKPAPKVYIQKSYYDLRDEAKSLYERSGLEPDDTSAKTIAIIRKADKEFRNHYIGKYVKWTGGYIVDADFSQEYGGYMCEVEMDPGTLFSTVDVRFPVSKQEAMDLKTDKDISIDGMISSLKGELKVKLLDVSFSYTGQDLNETSQEESEESQNQRYKPVPST